MAHFTCQTGCDGLWIGYCVLTVHRLPSLPSIFCSSTAGINTFNWIRSWQQFFQLAASCLCLTYSLLSSRQLDAGGLLLSAIHCLFFLFLQPLLFVQRLFAYQIITSFAVHSFIHSLSTMGLPWANIVWLARYHQIDISHYSPHLNANRVW